MSSNKRNLDSDDIGKDDPSPSKKTKTTKISSTIVESPKSLFEGQANSEESSSDFGDDADRDTDWLAETSSHCLPPEDPDEDDGDHSMDNVKKGKRKLKRKKEKKEGPKVAGGKKKKDGVSERTETCDLCMRVVGMLVKHKKGHDKDESFQLPTGVYKCTNCLKHYDSSVKLATHRKNFCPLNVTDTDDGGLSMDNVGKLRLKKKERKVPKVAVGKKRKDGVSEGTKTFICHICEKETSAVWALNRHLKSHNRKKRGTECASKQETCDLCMRVIRSVNSAEHKKGHEKDESSQCPSGLIKCMNCLKCYNDWTKFRNHRRFYCPLNATGENITTCGDDEGNRKEKQSHREVLWKCDNCNAQFQSASEFKAHSSIHREQSKSRKNEAVRCPKCDRVYAKFCYLKIHYESVHVNKGACIFKCDICQRGFNHKKKLKWHKKTTHGNAAYKCRFCRLVFATKDRRRGHENNKHRETNICEFCGRVFKNLQLLGLHKKKCPMNPNRQQKTKKLATSFCSAPSDNCNKSLNVELALSEEEPRPPQSVCKAMHKIPQSDRYECQKCCLSFEKRSNYLIHMQKCQWAHKTFGKGSNDEEGARLENKACVCDTCKEIFPGELSLLVHESVHQMLVCEGCNESMPDDECLLLHVLLECPERYKHFSYGTETGKEAARYAVKVCQSDKPTVLKVEVEKIVEVPSSKTSMKTNVRNHKAGGSDIPSDVDVCTTCNICTQQFDSAELLILHELVHHTHYPSKNVEEQSNNYSGKELQNTDESADTELNHTMFMKNNMRSEKTVKICIRCNVEFCSAEALKEHQKRIAMLEAKYPSRCPSCSILSKWLASSACEYLQHKKKFKFMCQFCRHHCQTSWSLQCHIVKCHDYQDRKECPGCRFVFGPQMYKQHVEYNRKEVGRLHRKCLSCGTMFSHNSNISGQENQELDDHAHKLNKYRCDVCNQHFKQFCNLKTHKQRYHNVTTSSTPQLQQKQTNKVEFQCKHCDQNFQKASQLSAHVKHLLEEEPYESRLLCSWEYRYSTCLHCGMTFTKHSDWKIHTSLWRCKCVLCSAHFTRHKTLKKHHHEHTDKQKVDEDMHMYTMSQYLKCKYCGHGFDREEDKRIHESLTSGNPMSLGSSANIHEFPCACEVCSKILTSACQLDIHMTQHKQTSAVSCRFCRKRFNRLSGYLSLASHTTKVDMIHTNCSVCGLKFINTCHKRMHAKKHSEETQGSKSCGPGVANVEKHKREVSVKLYCSVCNEEFPNCKRLLNKHWIHAKKQIVGKVCAFCRCTISQSKCNPHERFKQNNLLCSCGVTIQSKCQKKLHDVDKQGDKFVCKKCGAHFGSYQDLLKHLMESNSALLWCAGPDDNNESDNPGKLSEVLIKVQRWDTVEKNGKTIFTCLYCRDEVETEEEKDEHQSTFKYECPQCRKHYRSSLAAIHHFRNVEHVVAKYTKPENRKQKYRKKKSDILAVYVEQSVCDQVKEVEKKRKELLEKDPTTEFHIGLKEYSVVTQVKDEETLDDCDDTTSGSRMCEMSEGSAHNIQRTDVTPSRTLAGKRRRRNRVDKTALQNMKYRCPHCKKAMTMWAFTQYHLDSNSKGLLYTCLKCDASFDMECGFQYHLERMCKHCGAHFDNVEAKSAHAKHCRTLGEECNVETSGGSATDEHEVKKEQESYDTEGIGITNDTKTAAYDNGTGLLHSHGPERQNKRPIKQSKGKEGDLIKHKCKVCMKKGYSCFQDDDSLKWMKCECLHCNIELPTKCHINYHSKNHVYKCGNKYCRKHFNSLKKKNAHTCISCELCTEVNFESSNDWKIHKSEWHSTAYKQIPVTPPAELYPRESVEQVESTKVASEQDDSSIADAIEWTSKVYSDEEDTEMEANSEDRNKDNEVIKDEASHNEQVDNQGASDLIQRFATVASQSKLTSVSAPETRQIHTQDTVNMHRTVVNEGVNGAGHILRNLLLGQEYLPDTSKQKVYPKDSSITSNMAPTPPAIENVAFRTPVNTIDNSAVICVTNKRTTAKSVVNEMMSISPKSALTKDPSKVGVIPQKDTSDITCPQDDASLVDSNEYFTPVAGGLRGLVDIISAKKNPSVKRKLLTSDKGNGCYVEAFIVNHQQYLVFNHPESSTGIFRKNDEQKDNLRFTVTFMANDENSGSGRGDEMETSTDHALVMKVMFKDCIVKALNPKPDVYEYHVELFMNKLPIAKKGKPVLHAPVTTAMSSSYTVAQSKMTSAKTPSTEISSWPLSTTQAPSTVSVIPQNATSGSTASLASQNDGGPVDTNEYFTPVAGGLGGLFCAIINTAKSYKKRLVIPDKGNGYYVESFDVNQEHYQYLAFNHPACSKGVYRNVAKQGDILTFTVTIIPNDKNSEILKGGEGVTGKDALVVKVMCKEFTVKALNSKPCVYEYNVELVVNKFPIAKKSTPVLHASETTTISSTSTCSVAPSKMTSAKTPAKEMISSWPLSTTQAPSTVSVIPQKATSGSTASLASQNDGGPVDTNEYFTPVAGGLGGLADIINAARNASVKRTLVTPDKGNGYFVEVFDVGRERYLVFNHPACSKGLYRNIAKQGDKIRFTVTIMANDKNSETLKEVVTGEDALVVKVGCREFVVKTLNPKPGVYVYTVELVVNKLPVTKKVALTLPVNTKVASVLEVPINTIINSTSSVATSKMTSAKPLAPSPAASGLSAVLPPLASQVGGSSKVPLTLPVTKKIPVITAMNSTSSVSTNKMTSAKPPATEMIRVIPQRAILGMTPTGSLTPQDRGSLVHTNTSKYFSPVAGGIKGLADIIHAASNGSATKTVVAPDKGNGYFVECFNVNHQKYLAFNHPVNRKGLLTKLVNNDLKFAVAILPNDQNSEAERAEVGSGQDAYVVRIDCKECTVEVFNPKPGEYVYKVELTLAS